MAVDIEHRPITQELLVRIESHAELNGYTRGRKPRWFGEMLTTLALAVGADPIQYLTATRSIEADQATVTIAVFTPELLITMTSAGAVNSDATDYSTTVTPRSDLTSFTIAADRSVFSAEAFEDWPGALRAELTFRDARTLAIPMGRSDTAKYRDEIRPLLASLRTDLTRVVHLPTHLQ